ncbi:LysR family transcriptional regulator [Luteibacter sp. ME-Dv--P-043b]|uniref:LysR family transcriptional regulator n=1 Tax=Luteibacter sp. ME-Dv--P-043b TaxID=3040291 RepID=UPI002555ED74|nr:LysR family transcriptional regulator [Luteibacter sp. ME-Dv--P-043b]
MDLKRIRYFVAVARLRNFTHAASALRIAQSPLSRRIQELETELGVVLIDRDSRPLTLTEAGKIFYEQAVQLLQRTDAMVAAVRSMRAGEQPRFVFGVIPASFHVNVAQIIRRFAQMQPHLNIGILELNSTQQIAALRERRIDAGFGRVPLISEGVHKIVLREEQFVAAIPGDHALAEVEGPVSLEALAEQAFVIYNSSPRPSLADTILAAFAERELTLRRKVDVELYETAMMMVSAGLGVTIAPASARSVQPRGVAFRPLVETVITPIVLCCREGENDDNQIALRRVLAEYLGDQGYPVPQSLMHAS